MKDQGELIREEDWDFLLVLDACRFDYFKELYRDYLDGKLLKVKSRGRHTEEWLTKTFPKYYPDITYFSANGHVNSIGTSLKETHSLWEHDWRAVDHFREVIDVWDFGWVKELGSVPPEAMTEALIQTKTESKKIAHYIQPHIPFLDLKGDGWNFNVVDEEKDRKNKNFEIPFKNGIRSLIRFIGQENFWYLKKTINISPSGSFESAYRDKGIRYHYEKNLRYALKSIRRLAEETEGKIVVTADHGNAFGEEGYWGHLNVPSLPVLVEVPWLVVGEE